MVMRVMVLLMMAGRWLVENGRQVGELHQVVLVEYILHDIL